MQSRKHAIVTKSSWPSLQKGNQTQKSHTKQGANPAHLPSVVVCCVVHCLLQVSLRAERKSIGFTIRMLIYYRKGQLGLAGVGKMYGRSAACRVMQSGLPKKRGSTQSLPSPLQAVFTSCFYNYQDNYFLPLTSCISTPGQFLPLRLFSPLTVISRAKFKVRVYA